jgi:hypothetical protein
MLISSLPVLSFKGYHISNKQHVTFSGSTPNKSELQFEVEYTGELFLAKKKKKKLPFLGWSFEMGMGIKFE